MRKTVYVASFLLLSGLALPSAAATLTTSQANVIVTQATKAEGFGLACYPLNVHNLTVKGHWALVWASCHSNPDAVVNAILHQTGGTWKFACGHGDDVMYAQNAIRKCGMTRAEAISLGFQDQPH